MKKSLDSCLRSTSSTDSRSTFSELVPDSASPSHYDNSDSDNDNDGSARLAHIGKNSTLLTAGIIIADVVGAGILGIPHAVAQLGWLQGLIVMVLMLAINIHTSILLWRVRQQTEAGRQAETYRDLCIAIFAKAPRWQQRLSDGTVLLSQFAFIFGMLGVYILSAGRGFGMLFFETQWCLPVWTGVACAVVLPFVMTATQMGSHQTLVWLNIATLSGTVLIPLCYYQVFGTDEIRGTGDGSVVRWTPVEEFDSSKVLSSLSTFAFGMTSQFMLVEIIAEMKEPDELPRAYIHQSAPFQLAAFVVAGLGGYYYFGDQAWGMINDNLPFNLSIRLAAFCLLIHMLITYVIKGVVISRVFFFSFAGRLWGDVPRVEECWRARILWNFIGIVLLAWVWVFTNLVPFFSDAVDLLGASLTPISCFLMPIAMYLRFLYDAGPEVRSRVPWWEWILMAMTLALALLLVFFGTASSLGNLREHWKNSGYPFQCHCTGLWDTCECSAGHAGMLDQCPSQDVGGHTLAG